MKWNVTPSSPLPIYQQLSQQIREAVAQGRLQPDEQLPSVRDLSKLLVVNPNTIARTYTELEREGVLYTRQGLGVFVSRPVVEQSKSVRTKKLQESLDVWLTSAVYLGFRAEEVEELLSQRLGLFQWDLTQRGKK